MVLLNGKVVTMDVKESIAEGVAVGSGRILAAGSSGEIESLARPGTKIIDLQGRTVIPGLIESHCHLTWGEGTVRAMGIIDGSYEAGVRSIADIQARIAEQVKTKRKGQWISVAKEDDSKLAENRHPTKWDLDKVAPDHPVIIDTVGGHFAVVNSKAFELAGISKESPDPVGGRFERNLKTGELTGWIHERARQAILPEGYGTEPTLEQAVEGIRWMTQQYAASGLTCANDGGIRQGVFIRAFQVLLARGELPIRIRIDPRCELMPHLTALGIREGFGNEMLKVCAVKITADGAISARTAAVAEPYLHRPNYYGELAITKEELRNIVMEGYPQGYRFAIHANGERAINMALDVLEEAQEKYPRRDARNKIIHCTVVTPEIVSRMKKLGILPTIFGPYPYYHGDKIMPAFGADRLERMFAARSFLDAGIRVSAHSDHTASPYPPLMGIHALVNRRTAKGLPIGTSQKISVMEAIKLYTINAAYQGFEDDLSGSIEPGKFADMTVLGGDILTARPETIKDIPIDMTIVSGTAVYQKKL